MNNCVVERDVARNLVSGQTSMLETGASFANSTSSEPTAFAVQALLTSHGVDASLSTARKNGPAVETCWPTSQNPCEWNKKPPREDVELYTG